jgi:hypothetical protein
MKAADKYKQPPLLAKWRGILPIIPHWHPEKCQARERHTCDHWASGSAHSHERDHYRLQPRHLTKKKLRVGK